MAKRQFEPLLTRWENLADAIRRTKGNLDFGDIDPTRGADEQRNENAVAVQVEDMITDLRALASELGAYFNIYVEDEIKTGVEEALRDEETFQKMVALMIKEGKLEGVVASAALEKTEEPEADVEEIDDEDKELEAELAQLEADEAAEAAAEYD